MNHFDPARPRTAGGAPAWLAAPNLALPSLVLTPTEMPSVWDLKFMFPSQEHSGAFHWVGKEFNFFYLERFLEDWEKGPEEAMKKHFDLEAPSGRVWKIRPQEDPLAEPVTTLRAEELGL